MATVRLEALRAVLLVLEEVLPTLGVAPEMRSCETTLTCLTGGAVQFLQEFKDAKDAKAIFLAMSSQIFDATQAGFEKVQQDAPHKILQSGN